MPARKKPETPVPPSVPGKASTINDIARLSGVSKKTVSRIINHSPLVRKDTREKVEALMRQVGYSPDPMARGLAFRKSFLIGMVYDNPTAQYIVNMQYGALDAMRDSGFELVVHPCDSRNPNYIDGVRRFVQQQKLHGVMLVPRVSEDQALADTLLEIGCRYVRIASVAMDEMSRMVVTHDRDGAAEAADYLHIARPSRHRADHRPQQLPFGTGTHLGFRRSADAAWHRTAEVAHHRSRLHLRIRRRRRGETAGGQAAPDRDLHRQRRNGRRRVQGRAALGDQHPAAIVGGRLRRQLAGFAPVAVADQRAPADPRHRPPGRLDAGPARRLDRDRFRRPACARTW